MNARRVGSFLALWSFVFACVHVAWALGWRGGVADSVAPISERPPFLAYDLLAGGAMFGAAAVAWVVGRGTASPSVHGVLVRATLAGSVLALLRGVPALGWDIVSAAPLNVGLFADVWFTVAGGAGLLLWRLGGRRPTDD
jgi:hypothetical protein